MNSKRAKMLRRISKEMMYIAETDVETDEDVKKIYKTIKKFDKNLTVPQKMKITLDKNSYGSD